MHPSTWIIFRIPLLKSSHYLQNKVSNFGAISLVSFSTSTPKISIFDYLVNQHNLSPECASKVSSLSTANYINKPQNADSVLNFLKETGLSKNQVESVLQKVPTFLSAKLETTIKPKIKVLEDLGFHSADFANIISTNPWLLNSSPDRLRQSILGFRNVLGPNADLCRLLMNFGFGKISMHDSERIFVHNIDYLKSCGICSVQIASYVCRYPLIFIVNRDKFKGIVQRVDEMGVHRESKMFLVAVRVLSCMTRENWELKLQVFRDSGFSEQNILVAFRVCPQAFFVSEKKIKEVTQLLRSVEDLAGICEIVRNPVLLTYSVEKRLKPRLQVIKALQSKNLLKKIPGLVTFCQISDANFRNKYVIPYSDEVGDLYMVSQGSLSTS